MYNNKGESKMAKEYNHSDHIAVLSELTTLYKLKNEIQNKIDVADKVNEVHNNDNDGSEDLHKLEGKRDIPIKEILLQIKEKRDLPHLIIEAHKKRHNYSDEDLMNNILGLREIVRN